MPWYSIIKFLNHDIEEIGEIIRLAAIRKLLPETIIEKDMRVFFFLDYL